MGMSHPKTRQTCQAPLLKITGIMSGVVTPKDKTKSMSSPLAENNWSNEWGRYTQRQDKINAKPPC